MENGEENCKMQIGRNVGVTQKLNDVIDSLNEKQTNSKLKDVVQDEQLNGKEEEETHKK